ncbi:MAG TPA: DUF1801 domain-containing protein [Candidatus Limnocylindria bacterium]|nr:DUF1801 domain-containing protein [Candidatus Limnocylindria bacterium]
MATTKTAPSSRNAADGKGFTSEEKAAMRERAKEQKAANDKEGGRKQLLAKLAELTEPDKSVARRVHEVVSTAVPELDWTTWYGMPAYARGGKVICFFQPASKFKARYSTFGFSDEATLDDGAFWPTSYAVTELSATDEKRIAELVKKAVG